MISLFTRIVLIASEVEIKDEVHFALILCKQKKMISTSFKIKSSKNKKFEMILL